MLTPLLIALALPAADLADLPDGEVADRAAAAFAEGVRLREDDTQARPHFAAAAAGYEELWRRGIHNTALARNRGRAWLLAGDLPRALLACRAGLRLAPGDRALRDDLAALRELVVYPPYSALGKPAVENRPPWWPSLGPGTLTAAAAVFYSLACVGLTRWLMARRGTLLVSAGLSLVAAGGLAFFAAVAGRQERQEVEHPPAVIAADGVRLRRGDGPAYPPRYDTPLNRGVEARLLFARGDWLQVELAGGEVGWVPRRSVLTEEF
jgi:hypothetical protein